MAFFEEFGETVTNKSREVADLARKLAEIARLKGQINGMKSDIKKNYRLIGEAYYEAYEQSDVVCEFEGNVQAIRDAKKAMEELEKKISELKGDIRCTECGSNIATDSAFCPKCGARVELDAEEGGSEDYIIIEEEAEAADTE